ncbi:hypothetical protein GCK72_007537 [Caenorhabditis remanei]|uniref:SET domain-containing protein n=1 Tax=Caenorhabditis remanei TaxID=31234 RepID=A0A6A5HI77_CAERE|nr:hypothetical protein GCK72_007537 [Caenorhabditis remanei]KAF1767578.1 hypothetical protein GCK72_007537 [Caenorhabditis remanei]
MNSTIQRGKRDRMSMWTKPKKSMKKKSSTGLKKAHCTLKCQIESCQKDVPTYSSNCVVEHICGHSKSKLFKCILCNHTERHRRQIREHYYDAHKSFRSIPKYDITSTLRRPAFQKTLKECFGDKVTLVDNQLQYDVEQVPTDANQSDMLSDPEFENPIDDGNNDALDIDDFPPSGSNERSEDTNIVIDEMEVDEMGEGCSNEVVVIKIKFPSFLLLENSGSDCFMNGMLNILNRCRGLQNCLPAPGTSEVADRLRDILSRQTRSAKRLRELLPASFHKFQQDITEVFPILMEMLTKDVTMEPIQFLQQVVHKCDRCMTQQPEAPTYECISDLFIHYDEASQLMPTFADAFSCTYTSDAEKNCRGARCGGRLSNTKQISPIGDYHVMLIHSNNGRIQDLTTNSIVSMFGSQWKIVAFVAHISQRNGENVESKTVPENSENLDNSEIEELPKKKQPKNQGHYKTWVEHNRKWTRVNDNMAERTHRRTLDLSRFNVKVILFEKVKDARGEESDVEEPDNETQDGWRKLKNHVYKTDGEESDKEDGNQSGLLSNLAEINRKRKRNLKEHVHWKKRGDFKKQIISSTGDMDYSDHDAPEVIRVDDQDEMASTSADPTVPTDEVEDQDVFRVDTGTSSNADQNPSTDDVERQDVEDGQDVEDDQYVDEARKGRYHGSWQRSSYLKYPGIPSRKFSSADMERFDKDEDTQWSVQTCFEHRKNSQLVQVLYVGWACDTIDNVHIKEFRETSQEVIDNFTIRNNFLKRIKEMERGNIEIQKSVNREMIPSSELRASPAHLFWLYQDLTYFHSLMHLDKDMAAFFYMCLREKMVKPPCFKYITSNVANEKVKSICENNPLNTTYAKLKKDHPAIIGKSNPSCENSKECKCGFIREVLFKRSQWKVYSYNIDGRLNLSGYNFEQERIVIECSDACGCSKKCPCRALQRGQQKVVVVYYEDELRGFGMRAAEKIKEGDFVCEYVGDIKVAKENQKGKKRDESYDAALTVFDKELAICSANIGNISRFMAHACSPSATFMEAYSRESEAGPVVPRIGVYALKDIEVGEEITISYFGKKLLLEATQEAKMTGKGTKCGCKERGVCSNYLPMRS